MIDSNLSIQEAIKTAIESKNARLPLTRSKIFPFSTNNDDVDEFKRMSKWLLTNVGDQVPIHFSAFHPDYKMLDLPRTSKETLTNARNTAKSMGLKYVYTGNVHDRDGDTTCCGNCGHEIIVRDWYDLKIYKMNNNKCPKCSSTIPVVFDTAPGDWGNKRKRVKMC